MQGTVQKWLKNDKGPQGGKCSRENRYLSNQQKTECEKHYRGNVKVAGSEEIKKFQGVGRVINMDVKVLEDDSREIKDQHLESYKVGNQSGVFLLRFQKLGRSE